MTKADQYKLTPQQEKFACEVAKGESKAEAYRTAFPNSRKWKDEAVWVKASELAKRDKVKVRIAELLKKAADRNEITIDRVLKERARLAFFDVRKLLRGDGTPKSLHELDDDTAAAIQGVDVYREKSKQNDGGETTEIAETVKYKLADKNSSLTALEKYLGIYKEDDRSTAALNIVINLS